MLRLALYELEFEGLAPHALDEHVELARRVCQASGQGYVPAFANGVLREAGRRAEAGALPTPQVRMGARWCGVRVCVYVCACEVLVLVRACVCACV